MAESILEIKLESKQIVDLIEGFNKSLALIDERLKSIEMQYIEDVLKEKG